MNTFLLTTDRPVDNAGMIHDGNRYLGRSESGLSGRRGQQQCCGLERLPSAEHTEVDIFSNSIDGRE